MIKIFSAIILFFLPSIIFSQGVYKTNIGFTAGANIPVASSQFTDNYKASYNVGFHVEHTTGKIIALGGEFNYSRFAPAGENTNAMKFGSVKFIMKVQDNTLHKNDVQFFLKGGAGLSFVGHDNLKPQHGGYIPLTYTYTAAAGGNYLIGGGNKLFAETSCRFFPGSTYSDNSLFLI